MRILFILRQNQSSYSANVKSGLLNSATFVAEFLKRELGYVAKVVVVMDGNGIDKEVHDFKPNLVLLQAIWCPPYKLVELTKKYPHIKWVVRVHSKIPFLSNEGIALEWLNDYNKIHHVKISFNDKKTNTQFSNLGYNTVYLPNVYYPLLKKYKSFPDIDHIFRHYSFNKHEHEIIHIGCFGAIRPMKNHLNQAVAAIKYADKKNKKLFFHINSSRVEQKGEQVLKNLRALFEKENHHKLIEWPWLSHEEFYYLVSKMDFGMQVSFSESFNIVCADFVSNMVPIIPGKDIDWLPDYLKADPVNVDSMIHKINLALLWKDFTAFIDKVYLDKYNFFSKIEWEKYLESIKPKHHH